MTAFARRWLVLADGASNDDVDDAAHEAGFSLVNLVPRGDVFPRQRIYARPDGATFVHDLIDHTLGARYVVVAGEDLDAAEAALRDRLPVLEPGDLALRCTAADAISAVRALRLLGIAVAGRENDAAREVLSREARSNDPARAEAARAAAAFAGIDVDGAKPHAEAGR